MPCERARGSAHIYQSSWYPYQEDIDTTTPQGELVFAIFASLAQFESALISERVKAGMARAPRPRANRSAQKISQSLQEEIKKLRGEDPLVSIKAVSKGLGTAYSRHRRKAGACQELFLFEVPEARKKVSARAAASKMLIRSSSLIQILRSGGRCGKNSGNTLVIFSMVPRGAKVFRTSRGENRATLAPEVSATRTTSRSNS